MNLQEIQQEQVEWVAKNFGTRSSWQPFVGMVEEIGELEAARCESVVDVYDAIVYIFIFMADFCTLEGFDLGKLYEQAQDFNVNGEPFSNSLTSSLSWVACGFLKKNQGVRGTPEENREKMREGLRGMLAHLDLILLGMRGTLSLPDVVLCTWQAVRKRDWKAYPLTGLPPVQETAGSGSSPQTGQDGFKGTDVV